MVVTFRKTNIVIFGHYFSVRNGVMKRKLYFFWLPNVRMDKFYFYYEWLWMFGTTYRKNKPEIDWI